MPRYDSPLSLALLTALTAVIGCAQGRATSTDRADAFISRGSIFTSIEADSVRDAVPLADGAWPKHGVLTIELTLAQPKTTKYRRPYVAVWIEDQKGEPVRFLTVWGKQLKYQRDLRDMWQHFRRHDKAIDAVTGPTRPAGEYKLTWDGLDTAGKPLPAGNYTVHVEVVREHGTRVHMKKTIACGGAEVVEKLGGNVEVDGVVIRFGK